LHFIIQENPVMNLNSPYVFIPALSILMLLGAMAPRRNWGRS